MTEITRTDARTIAVLADCRIRSDGAAEWSDRLLETLSGADLIVTLGGMGKNGGLDRLETAAPVIGVRGADDCDDPRTVFPARTLEAVGIRIGCIFDPVASGLASETSPFVPTDTWKEQIGLLFGGPVAVLLHASTRRPYLGNLDGIFLVNPGSALAPAKGSIPSFAVLHLDGGRVDATIAPVPKR